MGAHQQTEGTADSPDATIDWVLCNSKWLAAEKSHAAAVLAAAGWPKDASAPELLAALGERGLRRIGLTPVEHGALMKTLWEITTGAVGKPATFHLLCIYNTSLLMRQATGSVTPLDMPLDSSSQPPVRLAAVIHDCHYAGRNIPRELLVRSYEHQSFR